jgi:hypothetical protein
MFVPLGTVENATPEIHPVPAAPALALALDDSRGQSTRVLAEGSALGEDKETARSESDHPSDLELGRAFSFAFNCKNWFSKALIAGMLVYLPVIGRLTLRGWRLEIARRVFAGNPDPLPVGFSGRMLLDGIRLRLVWIVYQLPFVAANVFLLILPIVLLWALLQGDSWDDAKEKFKHRLIEATAHVILSLVLELWGIVGQFLFWAGMARYVHSGRWSAFFEIIASARLVFSHIGLFAVFLFMGVIGNIMVKFVQAILLATGVGLVFIPLLTTAPWNWFRGHLWGQLALITATSEQAGPNR